MHTPLDVTASLMYGEDRPVCSTEYIENNLLVLCGLNRLLFCITLECNLTWRRNAPANITYTHECHMQVSVVLCRRLSLYNETLSIWGQDNLGLTLGGGGGLTFYTAALLTDVYPYNMIRFVSTDTAGTFLW